MRATAQARIRCFAMPPFPRARWVAAALAVLAARGASSRAHEAPPRPRAYRGPLLQAAGNDAGALALTPFGVKVLDSSGGTVRTLWAAPGPHGTVRGGDPGGATWPGLTGDADFSGAAYDPDDIDDVDDPRLTDETVGRPWDIDEGGRRVRGSAPGGPVPIRPLVAVAAGLGWVVRSDGLWTVSLGTGAATRMHAADGARLRALAAGVLLANGRREPAVAIVDGEDVLLASGAAAFRRVGGPAAQPRALAVGPAGTVLVREAAGTLRAYGNPRGAGADGGTTLIPSGVDDVVGCGMGALVLHEGLLSLVTAEVRATPGSGQPMASLSLRQVGPAPRGSERLACTEAGTAWAAFGIDVSVSTDEGKTWTSLEVPPTRPILGVIPTAEVVWLALPGGLWPLVHEAGRPSASTPRRHPAPRGGGSSLSAWSPPSDAWRRWATLLPQVDVDFELGRAGSVRDVRGMVTASFRLDGPWSGVTLPRARWRSRAAGLGPAYPGSREPENPAEQAHDPLAAEERRALSRILEEFP